MTNKKELWYETYLKIRNILGWGLVFNLGILVFSNFQIIPAFNLILNGGIIVYLDMIR